jgi:hypothetical protein
MIKVVTIPSDQVEQIEQKLNALLALPDFKDFAVAASFPSPDASSIVLILQKSTQSKNK